MLISAMLFSLTAQAACPNTSVEALAACYQATLGRPRSARSVQVQVDEESHGTITRFIDAAPASAADALMRFDEAPSWFPDLRRAAILHRGGDRIRVQGSTALPWPLGEHAYEMDMKRVDYTLDGAPAALAAKLQEAGLGDMLTATQCAA